MADETPYQTLARVRSELAAETARANAAEMKAYDAYLRSILAGLCVRYEFAHTNPQTLMDHADRLAIAAMRTRRRYYEGLSPNVPPVPSKKQQNGVMQPK